MHTLFDLEKGSPESIIVTEGIYLYCALILYMLLRLMHLLVGIKHDFLKLVRHIASDLWNKMA